jgi:hypothetical protein
MRWWANREEILQLGNVFDLSYKNLYRPQIGVVAQCSSKARRGRDQKRSQWASWVYVQLLEIEVNWVKLSTLTPKVL